CESGLRKVECPIERTAGATRDRQVIERGDSGAWIAERFGKLETVFLVAAGLFGLSSAGSQHAQIVVALCSGTGTPVGLRQLSRLARQALRLCGLAVSVRYESPGGLQSGALTCPRCG